MTMESDYELLEGNKQIVKITVSELKNLIKESLMEIAEEKQFTETQYKALWKKQPIGVEVL